MSVCDFSISAIAVLIFSDFTVFFFVLRHATVENEQPTWQDTSSSSKVRMRQRFDKQRKLNKTNQNERKRIETKRNETK